MADRELKVIITGDPSSLQNAFKQVGRGSSRLGGSLKTLGKVAVVAGAALGAATAVGMKKAIDAASDLNEQINKSKVVFKQNSAQVLDWSDDLTSSFGLSQRAALEAAGTFGNMLVPMGIARGKAADMSKAMVELGGDMASFNNASIEDTLIAIRSGLAGETEPLRRFGVFLNEAAVQQEALSLGLVQGKEKLTEQEKAMARYSLILKQTKDTQGDFARSAGESMANQLRIASAQFENMAAAIGQVLLPYALQLLKWANDHMPQIQAVITTSMNAVVAVFEFLGPVIGKVVGWFQSRMPQITAAVETVREKIELAIDGIATAFQYIAQQAERHWPRVQAAAQQVANWYENHLEPTITSVSRNIAKVFDKSGQDSQGTARRQFGGIPPIIRAQMQNMLSIVNASLAILRGDWSTAWNELRVIPGRTMQAIVDTMRKFVSIIYNTGVAIGKAALDGIKAGFTSAFDALKNSLTSKMEDLKNALKNPWKISSPSKVTIEIGKQIAEGLGVGFGQGMVRVDDEFEQRINDTIDRMVQAVQSRRSALADAFSELTGNALSAFDVLSDKLLTDTEKRIAAEDAARAERDRQTNLADARTGLEEALAGGDPEEIKRAQEAVNEALFQIQRAADEKRAQQERAALDNRRALQRRHFEEELTLIGQRLETGRITQEQAQQKLLALFKRYKIPFKNAASVLGGALAEGLRESFGDVRKAARELAETIADEIGKLKIVVSVALKGSHAGGNVDQRASGGPVKQGNLYIVGERGPEFFVPNRSGTIIPNGAGGGGVYELHSHIYLDGRQITEAVQRGLLRYEIANGTTGISRL